MKEGRKERKKERRKEKRKEEEGRKIKEGRRRAP